MKYLRLLAVLLFLCFSSINIKAQNILVDPMLMQDLELFKIKEPLQLWLNFLKSKDDKQGAHYWNSKEVKQYSDITYFQLKDLDYFEDGKFINTLNQGTTVLSITKKDTLYKITSMLRFKVNDSVSSTPFIFHVYASIEKESGLLKLYNPFPINQRLMMQEKNYKNIHYVFPKYHKFNKLLAKEQARKIDFVEREFNLKLNLPTFIFTNNRSELYRLLGYDFNFQDIGDEKPFGHAFVQYNYVYTCGNGEYFPHELIHLLINPIWPKAHGWFIEGFATYFGESRGRSLDWHLNNFKKYYLAHPMEDYSDLLSKRNIDDISGYQYVVGGLFVKLAYEKGGAESVKRLMTFGGSDTEFYQALEAVLGIKKEGVNQLFRECFAK
jgi:hypothetical protein